MIRSNLNITLRKLRLKKKYILFAMLYGVSSLVIPLTTQFLVNNLAVSGILANTVSFLLIFVAAMVLSQVFHFCQVILREYIQRELFMHEVAAWETLRTPKPAYFFEIVALMKSFSAAFSHLVELALLLLFGLAVIVSFHPAFLVLPLIFAGVIFWVFTSWDAAVRTSVEESDAKYHLFYLKQAGKDLPAASIDRFLEARDKHFYFIKRNKILVGGTFVVSQVFIIATGIYLLGVDELSIGQLVSSEIILGGILVTLTKLPKTLEDLYDFETSKIKITYALNAGVAHE